MGNDHKPHTLNIQGKLAETHQRLCNGDQKNSERGH